MRLFGTVLLYLALAGSTQAEPIQVAAAISLKESLTEIARAYQAETGRDVRLTFGASGQLMAQIKAGAPVDVFIPAAPRQLDDLQKAGLIDPATRRDVAANALVLIVPSRSTSELKDFAGLVDPAIKRVAIGEPRTVPAGQYAKDVLSKLGLEPKLAGRLIYGANVRQVLDYVERGEVTAGIVYATDAREAGANVRIIATADGGWHEPIRYPAAVVKASRRSGDATMFLTYLSGEKAQAVLRNSGFLSPTTPNASTLPTGTTTGSPK